MIVDGSRIVGIIGWSGADYAPVSMEYIWYCFKMCDANDSEWYDRVVNSISCEDNPGDMFYDSVLNYVYKLAWSNWSREYRPSVNYMYTMLKTNMPGSIRANGGGDITSHITPNIQTHSDFLKSHPSTARQSRTSYGTWSEISSNDTRINPFTDDTSQDGLGK